MIIELKTGQENFPDSGSQMHAFVRSGGEQTFINKSRAVRAVGDSRRGSASAHSHEFGSLFTQSFDAPNGTLIELFGKRRASWQDNVAPCRAIFEVHDDAALIRIKMPTLRASHSNHDDYYMLGRFYIVTPEDFALKGVSVGAFQRKFYAQEAFDRLFEIEEIEPARRSAPIIETEKVEIDGDVREVVTKRRKRALDI